MQITVVGRMLLRAVAATVFLAGVAVADESRPLYVGITELQPNTYKVQWRVPPTVRSVNAPAIVMPDGCEELNPSPADPASSVQHQLCRCTEGLAGKVIRVEYPAYNPSLSTLMKLKALAGEQYTALLGPQEASWRVPLSETKSQVAKDYTHLGVQHIWAGTDHLLFLVCLLWIAGSLRRVLITITGFTLAHSVTLVCSALEVFHVPVPPVEAAIALSIVFLATEIAKNRRDSLTWRFPITVSSSFGLLHGFGFAAALGEVGLPQAELLTGLLFFNVGVEIGQVIFAVAVVAAIYLIRYAAKRWTGEYDAAAPLRIAMSYCVGGIASFWMVERCLAFLPLAQ